MKCTDAVTHGINTGEAQAFREKLRPQTEYNNRVIDRELTNDVRAGVIRPSTSPYATNLLVVTKAGSFGTYRCKRQVCVHMLN